LTKKRILITSISHFDPSPLRDLGYDPVRASTVRIAPDPDAVRALRGRIIEGSYDSAAFMSPRAIDLISPDAMLVKSLSAMRVYAVGPSTAGSLESRGIRVSGVPREYTSASLADLIAAENSKAPFRKMVVPRSALADSWFSEKLNSQGISSEELRIYTAQPDVEGINLFLHTLEKGVEAAVFTSRSSILMLVDYLRSCGRELEAIGALKRVKVIAIGPETARGLKSAGIDAAVLGIHSINGLVSYLKGDQT
jgi:uroporphyrinogen-III synthase